MMIYCQRKFHKVNVLIDACIIVFSYLLAYYLRFYIITNVTSVANEKWYPLHVYGDKLIFIVPLYLFLNYFFDLYTPMENTSSLTKIFKIILINTLGIVLTTITLYLQKESDVSRQFLIIFFIINATLTIVTKILPSYCLKIMSKKQQLKSW